MLKTEKSRTGCLLQPVHCSRGRGIRRIAGEAGPYGSFLNANRFQSVGIDSQKLQDGRRYLLSRHRSLYLASVNVRVRDDQADVGVAEAETAVLGVLFRRGGVYRAVHRLHDDVGRTAIRRRV